MSLFEKNSIFLKKQRICLKKLWKKIRKSEFQQVKRFRTRFSSHWKSWIQQISFLSPRKNMKISIPPHALTYIISCKIILFSSKLIIKCRSINCSFSNEKRQSTQGSNQILDDLTTNTPVLNGYLDTIEYPDSGVLKSSNCIQKSKKQLKMSSFTRSLPPIEKKGVFYTEEHKTLYR